MQIFKESQLDIPAQNLVPAKDKVKMSIVMDVYEDLAKVKGSCDKLDIYEESMRADSPLRKVFPESYYDDTLAAKHYRVACCQKLLQVVKLGHIDGSVDHSTRGLIAVCFEPRKPAQYVKRIPIKAKSTASGSAPPAKGEPKGIEAAIAAPGAIEQIDWNTTSRNPIALLANLTSGLLISLLYSGTAKC